jgi:exonuclease SbcD
MGIRVVMTPGNHDSPERISFGSRLMSSRGLFIASGLPGKVTPVVIVDAHGPVSFYPLPYVEPLLVRKSLEDQDVTDFDSAMARVMAGLQNRSGRSVCLAHCFLNGGEPSESERPLSIGGSSLVGTGHFDGFQLTLLGHLHRPQKISDTIFYAGTPLAYSFQESAHVKTVAIYDLAADGSFTREVLPLAPMRRVRTISGVLAEVLAGWDEDPGRDDYLWVELTDRGALFDYASRIRSAYPNVLNITRTAYENDGPTERIDIRGRSETEIVASFFRHVTGEELLQEEAVLMEAVMGEVFAGQQGGTP